MKHLVYTVLATFIVWLAVCGFCIFLLQWPQQEVMQGAAVSAFMIIASHFVYRRL